MTQVNTIDLTRRSPSYEARLSKYSRRGFEVHWPLLDRTRVDPTIFERSFGRTLGLARLLILEKLPNATDRDAYLDQRRAERGRPPINRSYRLRHKLWGNVKDDHDDEVAEWIEQEEVSNYHTFTVPYGPKFHAKKIEKLLYTKDLLLNAEWNRPKDREVHLHRHPAFFGSVEDVVGDCCGYCPKPVTVEEEEVAEEERKIYVSGNVEFIKDNPGRQAIGSFNPITDDDWTEMAYVSNTARLCQAIVDGDLNHVQRWCAQDGSDPNRRDYTGRTPLHLAVMSSTPEIVQCLIDHGARLVARLVDGKTALHLAAMRGNVPMLKAILHKSEENEEEEVRKEDLRKDARKKTKKDDDEDAHMEDVDDEDADMMDDRDSDRDMDTTTEGSYVKLTREGVHPKDDAFLDNTEDDPDVYDVNVLAWDIPVSPLHLAIVNGHIAVVKELVQTFGADVLLPVKLLSEHDKSPRAAILTLVLALQLPTEQATDMIKTLLELGASSAQADVDQVTAFHYTVAQDAEALFSTLLTEDASAVKRAINHLSLNGHPYNPSVQSPLMTAIMNQGEIGARDLLKAGARATIDFGEFMKSYQVKFDNSRMDSLSQDPKRTRETFLQQAEQPVLLALESDNPYITIELLDNGADPNTLTSTGGQKVLLDERSRRYDTGETILDVVRRKLKNIEKWQDAIGKDDDAPLQLLKEDKYYLGHLKEGTYQHWTAREALRGAKEVQKQEQDRRRMNARWKEKNKFGFTEKCKAVQAVAHELEQVEIELLKRGAKPFYELHPEIERPQENNNHNLYTPPKPKPFEVEFSFGVPNLTDARRDAYLALYEAAWTGDLEGVKDFTLAIWGPSNDESPLKIAVQDSGSQSPYSIAIIRGHLDLAKAILEIAQAQYAPQEAGKEVFNMRSGYKDSDMESNGDDIGIYGELVDDKFTIDNIGEVSSQVKSNITPIQLMGWFCRVSPLLDEDSPREKELANASNLMQYAIAFDNIELLRLLLDLSIEYTARNASLDNHPKVFSFLNRDFDFAIRLGRTHMLAEIIKRTGAGVPLEDFVKKSGVQVVEKPKYYQGLSVHGKKRKDWAHAGRATQIATSNADLHPPILKAALESSLDSVEWFFSDTVVRCYMEFAKANRDDKRLRNLERAVEGFDKLTTGWLGARIDLVIHCAVMSKQNEDTPRLLEYLIRRVPSSLNAKSSNGYTPLYLAYSLLYRLPAAKQLIEAGADQTCRDYKGNNLLHALLCGIRNDPRVKPQGLRRMLDLLDPRLRESLATERSSADPGSTTPLARWMYLFNNSDHSGYHGEYGRRHRSTHAQYNNSNDAERADVLALLLSFSADAGNSELEMLNGEGDTPLHVAVRYSLPNFAKLILQKKPALLFRENAAGRTPMEIAQDFFLSAERFANPPSLPHPRHSSNAVTARAPESFVNNELKDTRSDGEKVYAVCTEARQKMWGNNANGVGPKRKLVSLSEANEIAKRLASKKGSRDHVQKTESKQAGQGGQEEERVAVDEVEACAPADAGQEAVICMRIATSSIFEV
ncbi:hypothetical protein LTR04_001040 [Oleoguttula sp. CCFEE 6159]|nr:hypothetical protein LTR04_001040 [Oleoguttula sp. CCFEE 6159]